VTQSTNAQFLAEIAETFWHEAGGIRQWPCDLEQASALSLPLDIVYLSCLTIKKIESWLNRRNVFYPFPQAQSKLHGCLLAYRGIGFVFIDGSDNKDERLYTLAHEIAHFLLEYLMPRKKALALFGDSILEVLDGFRPPAIEERIDSVINSIDIHPYIHLLEHRTIDSATHLRVSYAENQADQLALELIAPFKFVSADLKNSREVTIFEQCYNSAMELLSEKYGVPDTEAKGYALRVAKTITGGPTVISSLGLD
jgi:hypothetical protein